MKKIISTIYLTFLLAIANAQSTDNLDLMRSNGKIYVVVLVVLIILLGLFFYVWKLDKKITKLENND